MAMYLGKNPIGENNIYEMIPSGYISPGGVYEISQNNIYNISEYASVIVDIPLLEDEFITGALFGIYSNSVVTRVGTYGLAGFDFVSINLPNVTSLGSYAFAYCDNLSSVTFGSLTSISAYAFYNCSQLTNINFASNFSTVPSSAFIGCGITNISFANCTSIGGYAFSNCRSLTTVSFPNVTVIGEYAFSYCNTLTSVYFPKVSSIGYECFWNCHMLSTISLPQIQTISTWVFERCYQLISLNLTGVSSVPTLGSSNVFSYTPIAGYSTSAGQYGSIYVPASLYNDFLAASVWSLFSSRIVSV